MKNLVLEPRGLGDAVISTITVESLGSRYGRGSVDVWTRRECWEIFVGNPFVRNIYVSRFPIRIPGHSYMAASFGILFKALALHRQGYEITVSTSGDIREKLLQRLVGGNQVAPVFSSNHVQSNMVRLGHWLAVNRSVQIPDQLVNKYEIVDELIRSLRLSPMPPRIYDPAGNAYQKTLNASRVGLHIGAHQAIRTLPVPKWLELAKLLLAHGYLITIFTEPGGISPEMEKRFNAFAPEIRTFSGRIHDFLKELTECMFLIAGDSFAIHAANALRIKTLMLHGSVPALFAPRDASTLEGKGTCGHQPCWNKPSCLGTPHERSCLISLNLHEIVAAVRLSTE